jgi:predicted XRE-type DNA-binding protein
MSKSENYSSVWDAIADTPGQAANLRARAELMRQIAALIKRRAARPLLDCVYRHVCQTTA